MSAAPAPQPDPRFWRLESGDALRGVAMLAIVALHVGTGALFATGYLAPGLHTFNAYGAFGDGAMRTFSVALYAFFVLSGFLVSAPFVAAFLLGRPMPRLAPFFRNRAVRLLPAAWLLFAFVLVRYGARDSSFWELLTTFTLTSPHVNDPLAPLLGQTWSLRVDLGFYVLVPVAAFTAIRLAGGRGGITGRRRAVWAACAVVALASLVAGELLPMDVPWRRTPFVLLVLFMPGVALAAALVGRAAPADPVRVARLASGAAALGLLLTIALPRDELRPSLRVASMTASVSLMVCGAIVLDVVAGRAWRWTRWSPLRWLGRRSFGIYLWHLVVMAECYPLVRDMEGYRWAYLVLLGAVLAGSSVAAAVSYRFVEKPALRFKSGRAPGAVAPGPEPAFAGRPPDPPPARRLATGDPIRALAVLAVLALHVATGAVFVTGHLAGAGGTLHPDEAFGPAAEVVLRALPVSVYVFFALSGLLISRPFVEAFLAGRPMPSLGRYARNRALRLFPAAWLLLVFVFLRHGTRDATTDELISVVTLTETYSPHPLESLIGQLWSVRVELGFYVVVPLAALALFSLGSARLSPRGRRRAAYGLVLLGLGVGLMSALRDDLQPADLRGLSYVITAFMPGVALAAALAGRSAAVRPRRRAWRVGAATAFLAGLLLSLVAGSVTLAQWQTALVATLAAGLIVGAPVVLESAGGGTWRWLDNRVLRWVGVRSYGIYVWHVVVLSELYPLVRGMEGYKDAYAILLPATIASSCVVAAVSWRLVEQPALRLKRRVTPRPAAGAEVPQPAAPAAAVAVAET